ncbi:MAG: Na(+)-translocating NADH-quinone reductase subunit C [Deltaproteobacteria bacterium]|nr:Na(+)-translocating NADH-quinone reductase subunit C [Deltaproteobacteria bacterium]
METESRKKTILIALIVSLICSVLVSVAAVKLRPIQERNKELSKIENILELSGADYKDVDLFEVYKKNITPSLVELKTGRVLDETEYNEFLNVRDFDIKKNSEDENYGRDVSSLPGVPKIKRAPRYMPIYFVKKNGELKKIIFLIYGKALWSTMYGFIALGADLNTIEGLTFFEHGETPGLGGEVDNPRWKASWRGKKVFDDLGELKIEVIKGKVDLNSMSAKHKIDGLSGSTITTRGVSDIVRFWLGPEGYGEFIKKRKEAR